MNVSRRFAGISLVTALIVMSTTRAANSPAVLEGSAPEPLVRGALMPRVSPNGEWIAVSYQGAIGKVKREGGALQILSTGQGWDVDPAWSSDGRYIAYVSTGGLQIIDSATGAPSSI